MSEISDEMSQALCCAAAVRLDGALAVLADRAQLSDRYNQVVAGVESVIASLGDSRWTPLFSGGHSERIGRWVLDIQ